MSTMIRIRNLSISRRVIVSLRIIWSGLVLFANNDVELVFGERAEVSTTQT